MICSRELQKVNYLRMFKRFHVLEVFVSGGWGLGKGKGGGKEGRWGVEEGKNEAIDFMVFFWGGGVLYYRQWLGDTNIL